MEGRGLFTGAPVWVPYEMVHTAFTEPLPTGSGAFLSSTNGLSSGNRFLEALSHGLCDAVERDAATLHYVRTAQAATAPRVDLSTVDDPDCQESLGRLDPDGHDCKGLGYHHRNCHSGVQVHRCREGPGCSRTCCSGADPRGYFTDRLGVAIPAGLAGHAPASGFRNRLALRKAVWLEFWYANSDKAAPPSGTK